MGTRDASKCTGLGRTQSICRVACAQHPWNCKVLRATLDTLRRREHHGIVGRSVGIMVECAALHVPERPTVWAQLQIQCVTCSGWLFLAKAPLSVNHGFARVTPAIFVIVIVFGVLRTKNLFFVRVECKLVIFAAFVKITCFLQGTKPPFPKQPF